MGTIAASAFSLAVIVLRGYLYLSGRPQLAAILDVLVLPIFIMLSLAKRELVYHSFVVYLAASSIWFLPTNAIPFDLSYLIIIGTIVLLIRPQTRGDYDISLNCVLFALGALALYLFANLVLRNHSLPNDLQGQVKAIYYPANALIAGLLFAQIYRHEHHKYFKAALTTGIVGYFSASCLGYLFPLEQYTWQLETDFRFKSLFRYPGLSSSNYVANVLLVLIALHKAIDTYAEKPTSRVFYGGALIAIAIISQSRGYAISAVILVSLWWLLPILRATPRDIGKKRPVNQFGAVVIVCVVLFASIAAADVLIDLVTQTIDRFTFSDSSTANVGSRLDEWRSAYDFFLEHPGTALFGNLANTESLRPHNVILGTAFLFGIPIASLISVGIIALVLRHPIMLFTVLAAQVEILFFTGPYDLLFVMLLAVVSFRVQPLCGQNQAATSTPAKTRNA